MGEAAARPSAFKLSTLKNDHPIVGKSNVTLGEVTPVVSRRTAKNSSLGTGTRKSGLRAPVEGCKYVRMGVGSHSFSLSGEAECPLGWRPGVASEEATGQRSMPICGRWSLPMSLFLTPA